MSRLGNVVFWALVLGLALLMAYTLVVDTGLWARGTPRGRVVEGSAEVAVIYPERSFWLEFRQGIDVCLGKGIALRAGEGDSEVTLRTPRQRRLVRFVYQGGRGLRETKDAVQRLLGRADRPVAVVGSSNTVLTAAIAETLRDASGTGGPKGGPVLLIPWASSVLAERPEPGEGPVAMLDIDPGRTFRFCLNNQYQADLIVRCLADLDAGQRPRRAVVVQDRYDPYSVDLGACFHRAVEKYAPTAEIVERSDSIGPPVLRDESSTPTPDEEALAESIWRGAERLPAGVTTWVILPLQKEPTRRMLRALRQHSGRGLRSGDPPLRVLCGDTIGVESLSQHAGRCPFPVWCISPTSPRLLDRGVSPDVLIPAEIVAALVGCLDTPEDRPATADALRGALAALRLKGDDRAAVGRSLAFSRSGERVGDDLGHVLMIRPGKSMVYSVVREPSGRWLDPVALPSVPLASQP
jgi:hypothetical protein